MIKPTIAIFPGDDIEAYITKGEIRKNYFNPNNMFGEIFLFNFSEEKKIDMQQIQFMCGTAKVRLLFMGLYSDIRKIFSLTTIAKKVLLLVKPLKPAVIRTYGMLFNSYIAAYIARRLVIPFVVSLHDNYNDVRYIARISGEWKNYLFYVYWKQYHERYILNTASKILAVYGYAKKYALDMGVPSSRIELIYNRIDPQFKKGRIAKYPVFTVINVMRQNWMKNQEVLIRAIAQIPDARLILVGNGPLHKQLVTLAEELGCTNRVQFITRVMNKDLPSYYQRSHVFASPIKQGGVGIPDLEAFATGLPVIHAKYWDEKNPDVLCEYAIRVENESAEFKKAILQLKNNKNIYTKYSKAGLTFTKKINYKTMSSAEENIYLKLTHKHLMRTS